MCLWIGEFAEAGSVSDESTARVCLEVGSAKAFSSRSTVSGQQL